MGNDNIYIISHFAFLYWRVSKKYLATIKKCRNLPYMKYRAKSDYEARVILRGVTPM